MLTATSREPVCNQYNHVFDVLVVFCCYFGLGHSHEAMSTFQNFVCPRHYVKLQPALISCNHQDIQDVFLLACVKKTSTLCFAATVGDERGGLATPFVSCSTLYGARAHQQFFEKLVAVLVLFQLYLQPPLGDSRI